MRGGWFVKSLCLTWPLLFVALSASSYGKEPGVGKNAEVSIKEMSEVVSLLEDSQKREAFVKDIRNLIKVKESSTVSPRQPEKKQRKALFIENLFMRFESFSERIVGAAASSASLIGRLPETLGSAKGLLSERENLYKLLRLLGDVLGGILIALFVGVILRRYIPKRDTRVRGLLSKSGRGIQHIVVAMIPYGILLLSLFVLFKAFPSFPGGHSLALIFFMLLFFYRSALEMFRILLSPDEGYLRILPLKDENANYFWVWMLRFARYTFFYFLVTRALFIAKIPLPPFSVIRGILLVVFPILITVFVTQVARELRARYHSSAKNPNGQEASSRKIHTVLLRYWPIIAIAYSWVIFLFLIANYDKGFSYLFVATLKTAVTVSAIYLAAGLLDWLFQKLFSINERVKERFPGLEERTNRHIRIFRAILRAVLVVIGIGIIAQLWGIPIALLVASKGGSLIITRAIAIGITVGVVIIIVETSQFLRDYTLKAKKGKKKKKEPSQKMKTLIPMINTSIKIAAGFVGGIIILDQLGVNTTPILAGAGIVGLAVGFGSQTLVKDLINGLFMLFEESIRVGDYVNAGKEGGIVEAVGLRTVRLRDVSGNVHVIPNSSIDVVTNMSKEFSRSVIDIGIAYREDVDEVIGILQEIGEEMRNDPEHGKEILEPMEVFGLQSFDDSAVVIRVRLTTKPLKQWSLKREFNRRVKRVFDERGIEIPFPHRTIYLGEPKKGDAAPLHVQLQQGSAANTEQPPFK